MTTSDEWLEKYAHHVPCEPLPRYASVHGGVQPADDEPPPAAPPAPFPDEPLDQPAGEPERSIPRFEPVKPEERPGDSQPEPQPEAPPQAAHGLDELVDDLTARNIDLMQEKFRLDMALIATFAGSAATFNFVHRAAACLSLEDWRTLSDLAVDMHRRASELKELLEPICAELKAETGRPAAVN